MATYTFGISGVEASLAEQAILIHFTLDIDEETTGIEDIYLVEKSTKKIVPVDIEVNGDVVKLKLLEWAVPNSEYTLVVQGSIQSVVGDILSAPLLTTVEFESSVMSTISVLSPADFERTNEVRLDWREIGENLTGQFYIEVARESAFYNIVIRTHVLGSTDILLASPPEPGQYFFRVRAEDSSSGDYGTWSDTRTFLYDPSISTIITASSGTCAISGTLVISGTSVVSGTSIVSGSSGTSFVISGTSGTSVVTSGTSVAAGTSSESVAITETSESIDVSICPIVSDDILNSETFQLVSFPENGITPAAFEFLFNKDIDASGVTVTIVRSDF